jgi:hypothetical protein
MHERDYVFILLKFINPRLRTNKSAWFSFDNQSYYNCSCFAVRSIGCDAGSDALLTNILRSHQT